MSGVSAQSMGALRSGWSATVDDCAISGGWTADGEEFIVADAAGGVTVFDGKRGDLKCCLLYTSPSPRDLSTSRMPSSA